MKPNARIERCAYPELNGDEISIFCVSNQVEQNLATTFLRHYLPEPACPSERVIQASRQLQNWLRQYLLNQP